jgi:hypothetical protein
LENPDSSCFNGEVNMDIPVFDDTDIVGNCCIKYISSGSGNCGIILLQSFRVLSNNSKTKNGKWCDIGIIQEGLKKHPELVDVMLKECYEKIIQSNIEQYIITDSANHFHHNGTFTKHFVNYIAKNKLGHITCGPLTGNPNHNGLDTSIIQTWVWVPKIENIVYLLDKDTLDTDEYWRRKKYLKKVEEYGVEEAKKEWDKNNKNYLLPYLFNNNPFIRQPKKEKVPAKRKETTKKEKKK